MIARQAVTIRPASRGDVAACAALYERVRRHSFLWESPTSCTADDFARIFAGEAWTLAWAGVLLAGLASVFAAEGFVHGLYVDPAFQGQGIGRPLLAAGLAGTRGAARLKCNVGNGIARRFYQRLGWREVARNGCRPADWILYMHPRPERAAL
jgi:GNAT superfamily N-acetyltransferase